MAMRTLHLIDLFVLILLLFLRRDNLRSAAIRTVVLDQSSRACAFAVPAFHFIDFVGVV
jgi:hypothetical protein